MKLTQDYPKIFLYHRFCEPGSTIWGGISQDEFEWHIERVTEKYEVICFAEFLLRKQRQASTRNCAIITVDDGYRDFYQYAYPVLKKSSVPATLFVTSDFIQQRIWLWPDKLKYIVQQLQSGRYSFEFNHDCFEINTLDNASRLASWMRLSNTCIRLPLTKREMLIKSLSESMGIEVPRFPSKDYEACNWNELREMQMNRIEIGSHTLTHPVLSMIPVDEMLKELNDSKVEIEQMLNGQVSTFCYPHGGENDINDAVVKATAEAGYRGAVHGNPPREWNPFLVPRMGADDDRKEFIWRLCGMEYVTARIKALL
ncbi:polysaccharide deacetylase family protein [Geobacter pelophilus]|uniref:Polysaccharide deacetylase family protein n=2 Tax=Geoanaerobacter pelophilus TaxID=60036 RepID=A0AAW4L3A5_9BACT|nr:polysaccharide deacetylase family protein [Geoanaerobacter pelophilus]